MPQHSILGSCSRRPAKPLFRNKTPHLWCSHHKQPPGPQCRPCSALACWTPSAALSPCSLSASPTPVQNSKLSMWTHILRITAVLRSSFKKFCVVGHFSHTCSTGCQGGHTHAECRPSGADILLHTPGLPSLCQHTHAECSTAVNSSQQLLPSCDLAPLVRVWVCACKRDSCMRHRLPCGNHSCCSNLLPVTCAQCAANCLF
jgi:hypothetical protein